MVDEGKLISRIIQGDKNALKEIYELHAQKVYNLILNRFNDKCLADDITQDVFLTVYDKSISFRGDSQVSTWIYRIAFNKCLDELKRRKKTINRIDTASYQELEYEDNTKASVNLTAILGAVNLLKQSQKDAFTLVYLDKFSQQEASEIMSMNIKAFESLLYRARLSLQSTLSKNKGF
jgi:RNA polymerase sigma factor (sigma-70 family)